MTIRYSQRLKKTKRPLPSRGRFCRGSLDEQVKDQALQRSGAKLLLTTWPGPVSENYSISAAGSGRSLFQDNAQSLEPEPSLTVPALSSTNFKYFEQFFALSSSVSSTPLRALHKRACDRREPGEPGAMTPRTARPIQEFARNCASLSLKNCLPPSTKARRVISRELQFDPTISPIKNLDHDYFFGLPFVGSGMPHQVDGVLLPTMGTTELSRVRTALT